MTMIQATIPMQNQHDEWTWRCNTGGSYTVTSRYQILSSKATTSDVAVFNKIWNKEQNSSLYVASDTR